MTYALGRCEDMTSIPPHVLRHRATIKRTETVFVNGSPVQQTVQVAVGEACLLDTLSGESIPPVGASATQISEADRYGTLFVGPRSRAVWDATVPEAQREIRPGDTLTIDPGYARPVQTFVVQPVPSRVEGWAGPSHRELRVREA